MGICLGSAGPLALWWFVWKQNGRSLKNIIFSPELWVIRAPTIKSSLVIKYSEMDNSNLFNTSTEVFSGFCRYDLEVQYEYYLYVLAFVVKKIWEIFKQIPTPTMSAQVSDRTNIHHTLNWRSEDRASWYILTIKPTRYTNFSNSFLDKTLHVSDSFSVRHQEFGTVDTAMVYVIQVCCQQTCMTYHCCVYSAKLLMTDRETVRNM